MAVEESGELDAIITKEDLEREKSKLAQLKEIASEKKKLTGKGSSAGDREAAKEARENVKKQAKEVSRIKKELAVIKKKNAEQDATIKSALGRVGGGADPRGIVSEAVGEFMSSSRAVPIIGSIIAASGAVFKAIEKEFGDGGVFDLRVLVHDIVSSIVGLKGLADIDAGVVFMSADPSAITQIPEFNNTTNKRDGHVIYNQLTLGYI